MEIVSVYKRRLPPVAILSEKLAHAEQAFFAAACDGAAETACGCAANRERILEVARVAFTRHGANAALDEIARHAGIGAGTLYRHFPTRDTLVEAVFRSEVEKLTAAGERFAAELAPLDALRSWMLLFIDYVARKLLILPVMDTVPGGSTRLIEGTRSQIHSAFHALVQHAIDSGDLRADTNPQDIVRALIGVFHTSSQPGWEGSARRIVDVLIAGSQSREQR